MIDPFSFWFGGFLMAMVLNCIIVKEMRKEMPKSPTALVIMAMLWSLMTVFVLYLLIRDK
ncbi:hypothetical protein [Marinobacter nauticus]|uniref:Uncharacterized protein n=1 Tax=Marinobacter nauticus TaxID=2743 RepID=A0A833JRX3_MARNT|nr:hypothetical protein [Marinobacter nauticus]KAE8546123.1 hypothetical protein F6453_1369 [Marinobacter nauticus]